MCVDLIDELIEAAFAEYTAIVKNFGENYVPIKDVVEKRKKKHRSEERRFFDAMLIRLLLSILKFADVKDTINAYGFIIKSRTEEERLSISTRYIKAIEEEYLKYGENTTQIGRADV